MLIPNHQRELTKQVRSHCSKTVNVICSPLREQYLADALDAAAVEVEMSEGGAATTVLSTENEAVDAASRGNEALNVLLNVLSPSADKKEDEPPHNFKSRFYKRSYQVQLLSHRPIFIRSS